MSALYFSFPILILAIILGPVILSIIAMVKVNRMTQMMFLQNQKIEALKRLLHEKIQTIAQHESSTSPMESDGAPPITPSQPAIPISTETTQVMATAQIDAISTPSSATSNPVSTPTHDSTIDKITSFSEPTPLLEKWINTGIAHLKQHWLIWAGGLALLTGIAYLIEVISQYIEYTPLMRIGSAFALSWAIVASGEYFHRKESCHAEIGWTYVPAVITATGCMGLYASVISSYMLYSMLPPIVSLLSLGAISLLALSLYLRLGPLMAVLGLLAGFTAPLWFVGESSNPFALAAYISFITLSGLILANYVRRDWLLPLSLAPFYLWLIAILTSVQPEWLPVWSTVYFLLAIYFILAVPMMGWSLRSDYQPFITPKTYHFGMATGAMGLLILMASTPYFPQADTQYQLIAQLFLGLFMTWFPVLRSKNTDQRFLAPAIGGIAVTIMSILGTFELHLSSTFLIASMAITFSAQLVRTVMMFLAHPQDKRFIALLLLPPVAFTTTGWFMVYLENHAHQWIWTIYAIILAAIYSGWVARLTALRAHLYAVMHGIMAMALYVHTCGSDFSALLALQILVISWQIRQSLYQPAFWIIKLFVAIILFRVTLSIAIPSWQSGVLNIGGYLGLFCVLLTLFAASYQLTKPILSSIGEWFEGAIAHLIVITLLAQTHYWLLEPGNPWYDIEFEHVVIYCCETLAMSALYRYRTNSAQMLKWLYLRYSEGLFGLGLLLIGILNLGYSPLMVDVVSAQAWPVFNWLTLGWIIPAAIILAATRYHLIPEFIERRIAMSIGIGLIGIWLGMSIRQFWQPITMVLSSPTSMAEQITYSITGLIVGIICSGWGVFKHQPRISTLGLSMLACVAVKVVLVDTIALDGILRAISYLLLGSVLVAIGWLFQKLRLTRSQPK